MLIRFAVLVVVGLIAFPQPGQTCSYCNPNFQQKLTLRQNARLAKFIVFGALRNARVNGEKGSTEFHIEAVVQPDETLGRQKLLTIPSYIPGDPKNPQRYLLFGDFINGKLDVVHARPVTDTAAADYLKAALLIDDRNRAAVLEFCYKHLDAADAEVAEDAFHEFAKASDQEIAQVARSLAPEKLRRMLKDPKTPPDRMGIFAYLLGACGQKEDADLLIALVRKNDERSSAAMSGLLGGLIELQPALGWSLVAQMLSDPKRPFADKLNAHGAIRFFQSIKGKESRKEILQCLAVLLEQGDMADLAMEDLRRWQWWDLTNAVLAQYGKSTHAAPIVRKAIIRYALCSPTAAAAAFVNARRQAEPAVVRQVEESLEFEKPIPKKQ